MMEAAAREIQNSAVNLKSASDSQKMASQARPTLGGPGNDPGLPVSAK